MSRVEPLENRQLLAASLVSLDSTSFSSGNDDAVDPDISSNGRYVVFASKATDLVAQDTNANFDIYFRDLQTGITQLVSARSGTNTPGNGPSTDPSVSDDGRYVVFTSTANDLVAGDNNNDSDVFLRDLFTGETRLVSFNFAGTAPANGDSQQGVISDNGRFVAFSSDANNVTPNDLSVGRDVFVRDLESNRATLLSLATTGQGGNAASQDPSISASGQFIAFVSAATDLMTTGGTPGPGQNVYLYDTDVNVDAPPDPFNPLQPPQPTLTLVSTTGTPGSGGGADVGTGAPSVSDDGRHVAFTSSAADLVSGDVNGVSDIFRKDVQFNIISLVSQSSAGAFANGASARPKISADGSKVAFSSTASNLAAPDNGPGPDVFLRDVELNTTVLVSVNQFGNGGTGSSSQPAMTDDATIVAFASEATNLVSEPVEDSNIFVASTPIPNNDTGRPTFRVPPQPSAPLAPEVGDLVLPFIVIFDDNGVIDTATFDDRDLIVTGPNGFSAPATFFALTSTIGNSATVSYTVPAPGGSLSAEDNGTYTITVRGGQVADRTRNAVTASSSGTFVLNLPISETVLPVPTFFGGSPAVGSATYEFTVTYSERGGINFNTFGDDDIQVTGPNGFVQNATVVSSTPLNETQSSVIYRITAPGGTWDATDAGVYSVNILPGGVTDVAGNAVAAGQFGTFTALGPDLVAIPLRNLRSGAISGVDVQRAKIRILNIGSFPTTVPVAITLYTSLDETLDPGDATIGTFIQERPIEPDDFRDLPVRFTYPQVPAGDYFVISQVDSANSVIEQSETNNVAASFKRVGLSAPFVDLVPTLLPFSGNRSRIGTNEAVIKIRNAGNVAAAGDLVVALTGVSDVTPQPSERAIANVPIRISLKPGQTRTFRLPFTFPIELERGTYRLVATIDSSNVIPERDEVNNRVTSLSSFDFA